MAGIRLAAWCQTTLCGPVDDVGADLLAPVGRQAVEHDGIGGGPGHQRLVHGVPGEGRRRRSASSSWPIDVHTSV